MFEKRFLILKTKKLFGKQEMCEFFFFDRNKIYIEN